MKTGHGRIFEPLWIKTKASVKCNPHPVTNTTKSMFFVSENRLYKMKRQTKEIFLLPTTVYKSSPSTKREPEPNVELVFNPTT